MGTAFIQFQKKLFIAGLVLLFGPVAARADDALLEVLRHNKLITEDQYQTLRKAREKERAKLDRPLPAHAKQQGIFKRSWRAARGSLWSAGFTR
jgi:hypothetical protein